MPQCGYLGTVGTELLELLSQDNQSYSLSCNNLIISLSNSIPSKALQRFITEARFFRLRLNVKGLTLAVFSAQNLLPIPVNHKSLIPLLECINMISISCIDDINNLNYLREICNFTGTQLCYNHLAGRTLTYKQKQALSLFDQIYVIMRKAALGLQTPEQSYLDFLKDLYKMSALHPAVYKDKCVSCIQSYLSTGFKCSAGIDMIHLWPNGTITGCPYDSMGVSEVYGADLWERVERINNYSHPFDSCDVVNQLRLFNENNR
jgi:hypothetical protein